MREILFRGKQKGMMNWVEGTGIFTDGINAWLSANEPNRPIAYGLKHKIVLPETIGQFTGLTDKNGKKIFDGDIIEWFLPEVSEYPSVAYIEYDEESFAWRVCWKKYDPDWLEGLNKEYISVIGNIHDNPELLENP